MATLTIAEICNGIAQTISTAIGLSTNVQSYNSLTDGIQVPAVQVYPESGRAAAGQARSTSRTTMSGAVRQGEYIILADLYARQRSHIGADMEMLIGYIDAIEAILYELAPPFFGVPGIQEASWSWERVTFEYGDPQLRYIGARFRFTIHTF